MEDLLRKDRLMELVLVTGISFLVFQLSIVFFLFIVPVMYIGRKRGWHSVVITVVILLAAISVQLVVKMRVVESSELRKFVTIYGLSYPVALLAGALIVSMFSGRSLFKMLIASGLFAVVSIPFIIGYSKNSEVISFLKEQIGYVSHMVTAGLGKSTSPDASAVLSEFSPEKIVTLVKTIFLRDFVAAYFFLLSGSWFISDAAACRKNKSRRFKVELFTVPEWFIWIFIVSLVGLLVDHLIGMGWWGYLFWNSTLILLIVYGIDGVGVMRNLFKKYNVTRQKQRSVYMIIFILLIIPGINLVVLLGIPGLGVSELWVKYR